MHAHRAAILDAVVALFVAVDERDPARTRVGVPYGAWRADQLCDDVAFIDGNPDL